MEKGRRKMEESYLESISSRVARGFPIRILNYRFKVTCLRQLENLNISQFANLKILFRISNSDF